VRSKKQYFGCCRDARRREETREKRAFLPSRLTISGSSLPFAAPYISFNALSSIILSASQKLQHLFSEERLARGACKRRRQQYSRDLYSLRLLRQCLWIMVCKTAVVRAAARGFARRKACTYAQQQRAQSFFLYSLFNGGRAAGLARNGGRWRKTRERATARWARGISRISRGCLSNILVSSLSR